MLEAEENTKKKSTRKEPTTKKKWTEKIKDRRNSPVIQDVSQGKNGKNTDDLLTKQSDGDASDNQRP